MKSTPDEIRRRFDADVERFSDLEAGHAATMDARLTLDLLTRAAAAATPRARRVLDVGCGAGNYSLKLLLQLPGLDVTLLDLSRPMLDRAEGRVQAATTGLVTTVQSDVRGYAPGGGQFDIILAAAVLHHLRGDAEWEAVFAGFHAALRPGGGLWIFDMIAHELPHIETLMRARYGDYLVEQGGEPYRDKVFEYIQAEDSPRSLPYQLDLLHRAGFSHVEILHKNGVFAAFGAMKSS